MRTRLTKSVKLLPVERLKKRLKRLSLMPSSPAMSAIATGSARFEVMRLTMALTWSTAVSPSTPCICTFDSSR